MNITKWKALLEIVEAMPFPPAFVFKLFDEPGDEDFLNTLNTAKVDYWGDWQLNAGAGSLPALSEFDNMEYIRIRPSYSKAIGKYAADELIDITGMFKTELKAKQIPFETDAYGNIIIFGIKDNISS